MSTETTETPQPPQSGPSKQDLEKALRAELVKQQDIIYAVVGGLASAIVSAILYAVITVSTGYQIGYMAVGVGLLVGFSVRYFGAGIDQYFGFIGAFFALLGCALGNLLSQLGFLAHEESIGYFDTLSYLNLDVILEVYKASFSSMDVLFYAIAGYEGYRFGFRKIEEELVLAVNAGKVAPPPYAALRLPIVIGAVVAIAVVGFVVSSGSSGTRTMKYESGAKQAMGEINAGKQNGPWEMWWENGNLQAQGSFANGQPDGDWIYYNEDGVVSRKGSFKGGMEDGQWTDFWVDGSTARVTNYQYGRQNGSCILNFENGKLNEKGSYSIDQVDGEWETYYENGQLLSKGSYTAGTQVGLWTEWNENGKKSGETEYDPDGNPKILNTWKEDGKPDIVNGNGEIKVFNTEGNLIESGKMKDGFKDGPWKKFYPDGSKREEGEYRGNVYYVTSMWSTNGDVLVSNGTGPWEGLLSDGTVAETGHFYEGLRNEKWTTNYPGTDKVWMESEYKKGKLHGLQTSYGYEEGYVSMQGSYANDLREGEWKWFSSDNVLESVVTFVGGKKEGSQMFYNTYGDILKTEIYKTGKLIETKVGSE